MNHQEKELIRGWKTHALYYRDTRQETISNLEYRIKLLDESLQNKEKSIMALIERNIELQNTIKEKNTSICKLVEKVYKLKRIIENLTIS
jgi:predicted RNase H-like nuclease (RuvC/YqgF family)